MNNILVALNNQKIFNKLLEEKNINIINKNILYREGIIEALENNVEINYIIIDEKIPGEIELNNLINQITEINKKIKIILIIESNKITLINTIEKLIIIEEENISKILEKLEVKKSEEIKILEGEEIKKNTIKTNNSKKIFLIDGNNGSGKSIISTILSYRISKENKKVLLIDCDIEKGNIHTILQIKKQENKIQKINNNFYFINTTSEEKIEKLFNENFDIYFLDNYKLNLKIEHEIIYLLESNLIEIEKLKSKINIKRKYKDYNYYIINKYNKNCIDEKILKDILENKKIFKVKYNDKYNFLINNFKIKKDDIYFKKEYKNIIKKIM